MAKSLGMKVCAQILAEIFLTAIFASSVFAQGTTHTPAPSISNAGQIETLTKKIDEQNAKIDMLSQQILKLEQQLSGSHSGVTTGESTPATSTSASVAPVLAATAAPELSAHPASANGSSHVVARGETLTSIAKMHNVSVSELQKFNHIENDRKLQIGQTIMLPTSASSAPPASSPPQ